MDVETSEREYSDEHSGERMAFTSDDPMSHTMDSPAIIYLRNTRIPIGVLTATNWPHRSVMSFGS